MQKKKIDPKVTLPSVSITKPNENLKNYTPKSTLNKCRQVQQKNIYFQMPSIHQNDLSMKTFIEIEQKCLKKTQLKILKLYEGLKENKLAQEWDLYIKKSQIINTRSTQFYELQEFLVKIIHKFSLKINQSQLPNGFSFSKTSKLNQSDGTQFRQSFGGTFLGENSKTMLLQDRSKTMLLQDRSINQKESKLNKSPFKSILDPQNKDTNSWLNDESSPDPFSILSYQNVLLDKKADIYQKRILQLEQILQKFQQKQKQTVNDKDVNSQLVNAMMLKNKYKHDSKVKAMQIEAIMQELNQYKALSNTYKTKLDEVDNAFAKCLEQNAIFKEYLKYKELWLMAAEEANTWRILYQQQKQQNLKSSNKIKTLRQKNQQLLNYFNISNAVHPDQQQDKLDLDKIIKQFKQWLMIVSVPKVTYNTPNLNQQEDQNAQKQTLVGNNQIDYKLLRPNFYIFFQAYENTFLMQKNLINLRPIQYNFFLKMRTIFDTMFNAFQVSHSYKDYPAFPQFVVGFLQKYQLNPHTNMLQYRKKPIESEQKITFLVNLFNKNVCNTWQCDIFKNFLFQNNTLDQIYFFLDCRNQLNSGINANYTLGTADPISYVKLTKALKVVTKKLYPYENYIVEKVKSILKNKKKIKYGQSFIDRNFVLKILLQVYCLQRSKSQRIFQSSFKSKMKKSYITFGDFHHFMCNNFPYLSSVQISQLYRQVYTLSSGHITYKATHHICGVKGLFIPLMLSKRINKTLLDQSISQDMLLLDIQNTLTKVNSHLEQMGIQSFMRTELSINNFMRQLEWYKDNKAAFYQRLFIEQYHILKINMLVLLKHSYQQAPGESLDSSEIQNQFIQLHSLLHITDTQIPILVRQKEKRTKALSMLVRNFKIRIQESMLQFDKVNQEEIQKLKEQIQRSSDPKQFPLEIEPVATKQSSMPS